MVAYSQRGSLNNRNANLYAAIDSKSDWQDSRIVQASQPSDRRLTVSKLNATTSTSSVEKRPNNQRFGLGFGELAQGTVGDAPLHCQ